MIQKNEVNIYDIPIAKITEQYLEYLQYAARLDLDTVTDFYLMAATLLYIKSRMLLPNEHGDAEEEYDDPRKELVERLIEYQRYRKLTDLIERKAEEEEFVMERKAGQPILPFVEDDDLWESIDVWELLKTFSKIMSNVSADRLVSLYEEVTVNEKLTLIAELCETKREFLFTELVRDSRSIMELVCAFIALLEAVRQKSVGIRQNRMFGDIQIRTLDRPVELDEEYIPEDLRADGT